MVDPLRGPPVSDYRRAALTWYERMLGFKPAFLAGDGGGVGVRRAYGSCEDSHRDCESDVPKRSFNAS